jgi:hypothetical protein
MVALHPPTCGKIGAEAAHGPRLVFRVGLGAHAGPRRASISPSDAGAALQLASAG